MRTAFFAFVCMVSALAALNFGSSAALAGGDLYSDWRVGYNRGYVAPVGWRRSYRWYRDYAPLYARNYYRPPTVVLVPPPVGYYPKYGYRHFGYYAGW